MLDIYLAGLDLGYFEVQEAFKGLQDENVWKRPAGGLLSIGEIAGHVAYWEAVRFTDTPKDEHDRPDLAQCNIKSLLLDDRFRYYPTNLETPPSAEQLAMSAQEVCSELVRIHNESVEIFKAANPDLAGPAPFWSPNSNFQQYLMYASFHVSYHTGQIYTVRHLLGEQTPDN